MRQEERRIQTIFFRDCEELTGNPYQDTLPYSSYVARIDVAYFGEYQLRVYFKSGLVYEYDVRPLILRGVFEDYQQVFDVMSGKWQAETGRKNLTPGVAFQRYIKNECPVRKVQS